MAKKPANSGKEWTGDQEKKLRHMADTGKVTGIIAYTLGRSVPSVRAKASDLNISLKPTNKSPDKSRKPK